MPGKYLFRREINLSEKNPECALISHYNFPIFHKNPQNFARLRRAQYHFLCRIPLSKCIRKHRHLNKFARLRRAQFYAESPWVNAFENRDLLINSRAFGAQHVLNLDAYPKGIFCMECIKYVRQRDMEVSKKYWIWMHLLKGIFVNYAFLRNFHTHLTHSFYIFHTENTFGMCV